MLEKKLAERKKSFLRGTKHETSILETRKTSLIKLKANFFYWISGEILWIPYDPHRTSYNQRIQLQVNLRKNSVVTELYFYLRINALDSPLYNYSRKVAEGFYLNNSQR